MDFPSRLEEVLIGSRHQPPPDNFCCWNDEIERFLADQPDANAVSGNCTFEKVRMTSELLHRGFLTSISPHLPCQDIEDPSPEEAKKMIQRIIIAFTKAPPEKPVNSATAAYVRTIKNFLRWYLQIFLPRNSFTSPSPVQRLQSSAILKLMIVMLVKLVEGNGIENNNSNQSLARNINLFIFYATFRFMPEDEHVTTLMKHLTQNLDFLTTALQILTMPCTTQLALSVVRNIHNIAASSSDGRKSVVDMSMNFTQFNRNYPAPWLSNVGHQTLTFKLLFEAVLLWCIQSEPPYPGTEEDKRVELVDEILAYFYATKAGAAISESSQSGKVILDLLKLAPKDSNDANDARIFQTKLQIVSLLMDAQPSFAKTLVERDAVSTLIDILRVQAANIVDKTRVDKSAVAALIPILVCLNTFCKSNHHFLSLVKSSVFPPEAEETFQLKVEEQISLLHGRKNMGPLDAPPGTLRHKLIKLMTWTESYIKRCTGELMWTLCASDPKEFVFRVGVGNALPILNQRGLATIPGQPSEVRVE
jgi:hypothetical protein